MSENLLNIVVDDRKFIVKQSTLNKYPDSLLTKLIADKKNDQYVFIDNNTIYIDRNPESFTYIIDFYRGYKFDIEDISDNILKSKIITDLRYFGLYKDVISLNLTNDANSDNDNEVGEILKTCSNESNNVPDILELLFNKKGGSKNIKNNTSDSSAYSLQNQELNTEALNTDNKDQIDNLISNINNKLNSGDPFELIQHLSNDENMRKYMHKLASETQYDDVDLPELELSDDDTVNTSQSMKTEYVSSQAGGKKLKTRFLSID